jgi:hypothetical protein
MAKKPEKAKKNVVDAETAALAASAEAERKLLRREQEAELRLVEARSLLAKAEERYRRCLTEVAAAEAVLRARQVVRAAGPDLPELARPAAAPTASEPLASLLPATAAAGDAVAAEPLAEEKATVVLPDGSPASGPAPDGAPEVVAPRPRRTRRRAGTTASS